LALAAVCLASLPATAPAQVFTGGNLTVLQIGDGTNALSANGNPITLREFTPAGVPTGVSVAIPNTGSTAMRITGTAASEGFLSRSSDGLSLNFAGYVEGTSTFPSTVSLPASAATVYPRAVGTVNAAGAFSFTTLTGQFSTGNARSAVSDGTNAWAAGSNTGIVLAPSTVISTTNSTNNRVTTIANGNLSYSTGSGTRGIYSFAGTPTAAAVPTVLIATGATSSPYGFAINPAGNLAYVADDSGLGAANGGVQRWDFNGSTWANTYTLSTGLTSGVRGLTVDFSGANPVIYGIDAAATANHLISFTDIGPASAASTLATAGANFIFRGVAFSPVPEPTTILGACAAGAGVLGFVRRLRRKPAAD